MDTTRTLTRRRSLRLLGGAALAALPAVGLAEKANAGRGCAWADPVLRIDGQTVHVYIGSLWEMRRSATDKILLRVTLPPEVEGKLIDILSDFGKGYDVRLSSSDTLQVVDGNVPMLVSVYCPARD